MIIYNLVKKGLAAAVSTRWAEPIERDLGSDNLKPRILFESPDCGVFKVELAIYNFIAFHTNQVGVRFGTVAVVMTVIPQVDFLNLTHFLEQGKSFVDGGLAHCRELVLDF